MKVKHTDVGILGGLFFFWLLWHSSKFGIVQFCSEQNQIPKSDEASHRVIPSQFSLKEM